VGLSILQKYAYFSVTPTY